MTFSRTIFARSYCVLVFAALVANAAAQLITYEPFSYPDGSVLRGKNGGVGFSGSWFESGSDPDVVRQTSLLYPRLATAGNSLNSIAPTQYYSTLTRSLSAPIQGTTGTTLWASFLMRKNSEGTTDPPQNYCGLVLYPSSDSAPALYIGDTGETDFYSLGIAGSADGQVASTVQSVVSTSATLLVVRITFMDGPDTIDLFVNPDPAGPEPTVASATKTDLDLADISLIGILAGYDADWTLDEIRIGNGFADVAPRAVENLTISKIAGQHIRVSATGVPSQTYQIQASDDLLQPFVNVGSGVVADVNGNIVYDDTSVPGPAKRFYRIVVATTGQAANTYLQTSSPASLASDSQEAE